MLTQQKAISDLEELREVLLDTGGKIFHVTFLKEDGTVREANGRIGVTKHLQGGESTIAHKDNLFGYYDLGAEGYRCFDLSRVINVKCGRRKWTFNNGQPV